MAGETRGPTTAAAGDQATTPAGAPVPGEQLELTWDVPPASPATPDFVCWLWAAFPPRDGRLNVSRIAKALDISPTTLRRWIAKDLPKLRNEQVAKVHQRAILRGRGHYLWPDLDPTSRQRSQLVYKTAVRNAELIANEPDRVPQQWKDNGTVVPHAVHVIHWEKAHAFGVAMTSHDKSDARILRRGRVLETVIAPNKYAAIVMKQEILQRVDEHRCITPKFLVPTGHTETWREAGGPTGVRPPLEVAVVRFAGLERFAGVHEALSGAFEPAKVRVVDHVVSGAQEAAEALCGPADVVVLATQGWTRHTWKAQGTKRAWPGGAWFAGGRGVRSAGMSLLELQEELAGRQLGAQVLVVDAELTSAAQKALVGALGPTTGSQLVTRAAGALWDRNAGDLVTLIGRLADGTSPEEAAGALTRLHAVGRS
jgi:hypothetical protein